MREASTNISNLRANNVRDMGRNFQDEVVPLIEIT